MKKTILLLLCLITAPVVMAQSPPTRVPDTDAPDPGTARYYYENRGQIIDKAQNIRNDIRYYTTCAGVKMYLGDDTISFTGHNRAILDSTTVYDTSFRLDMQFYCGQRDGNQSCPNTIGVYEPSRDSLNYYLPHCGSSGIEGVPGYGGVVYQDAFPGTDVHFFSNAEGPITYFVFHPASDTGAFALLFNGQDSIQVLANYLNLYIGHQGVSFSDGVAYQIDALGGVVPLTWTPIWYKATDKMVKMKFGAYDPTLDLVIRTGQVGQTAAGSGTDNLVWTTYYGDAGSDADPDLGREWMTDGMPIIKAGYQQGTPVFWHAMTTNSSNFDIITGNSITNTGGLLNYQGSYDCVISSFDRDSARRWATYYGGSNYEQVCAMAVIDRDVTNNNTLGNLLVSGRTKSASITGLNYITNLPWRKATNVTAGGGNTGSFFASFGASNGRLKYSTFFGGGMHCYLDGLVWDEAKREIVFSGYISTNTWAIVDTITNTPTDTIMTLRRGGRYFQTSSKDKASAFIGAFDSARNFVWCTLVGGDSLDVINQLLPDKSGGLYALGNTRSRYESTTVVSTLPLYAPNSSPITLPFVKPNANAYCQTDMNWRRAFVLHFNSARAIDWGTLYGGGDDNEYHGLAVNSKNDVYIGGVASAADTIQSDQPDGSGYHRLSAYDATGSSYMQGYGSIGYKIGAGANSNIGPDAVIARFDSTHRLRWSTLFGKWGAERSPVRLVIDHADHVYMSGNNEVDTFYRGGPQGIPIYSVTGRYKQDSNASAPSLVSPLNAKKETLDGWMIQFNPSNQPIWSTLFGGSFSGYHPSNSAVTVSNLPDAREYITSMDAVTINGLVSLCMTGVTKNPYTPMYYGNGTRRIHHPAAYNDPTHGGDWDAFIGMFNNARATSVPPVIQSQTSNNITVAPNPSRDRFIVTFNTESSTGRMPLIVTNALGQVLLNREINFLRGENKFMLDLGQLPAGMYFIQLVSNGRAEAVRLLKY